jgi:hypothetical protein
VNTPFVHGQAPASDLGLVVRDFGDPTFPSGRSVYLQGQLHSNESAAMLVLWDLIEKLEKNDPANLVRVVPNANPVGWHRYLNSGEGRTSANGMNWNRIFGNPMRQPETFDDQLAQTLWQLSCGFDIVIDVHTPEFGWPHLYASSENTRLVTMDDIPHVLYGPPTSGPFDESHFRIRDINGLSPVWASVTIELPSYDIPTDSFIDQWSRRLLNEIQVQSKFTERRDHPEFVGTMLDIVPTISGAIILQCKPGQILKKGAALLTIRGRSGELEPLSAPCRCIPVCFRRATVVQAGYWVCRVISM